MNLGLSGRLTRATIRSPLTPLFLLAALAAGLVALLTIPREEEPQISVPMVDIVVQANGLKAPDAVELVTKPLEAIVKPIAGVEHVYSQTQDDRAVVTVRFDVGTNEDDAVLRVNDKIRANIDKIPIGIPEPLIVGRGINDVAVVVLTLSPKPEAAARWTDKDLYDLAVKLRTELIKVDNVGTSYIVGTGAEEIRVEPDPEKLSLFGVTLQQLIGKVRDANRAFVAGAVRDAGMMRTLAAGQTLRGVPDIGLLLLTTRDGRPVYVRDVAKVVIGPSTAESRVWNLTPASDGWQRAPAVSLALAKRAGANAVVVSQAIVDRVAGLQGRLIPPDMHVEVTRDYGQTANDKANELLFHLALATVSIVVLIALAIGWREAIVTLVVIPTTILLTLFAAQLMGYTINRVSLFALIFAIGILVDDAIVVVENIARHWAMRDGRPRMQAAIEAVAEVGNPTVVATLTVIAALLPMLFVSGLMGPYMAPIPANASAAMLFSFFVAMVVAPWLMLKLAPASTGHRRRRASRRRAAWPAVSRCRRRRAAVARPRLDVPARRRRRHHRRLRDVLHRGGHGEAAAVRQQVRAAGGAEPARRQQPGGHRTHAVRRRRASCARCRRCARCRPMPAPPRRSTSTAWCGTTICGSRRSWAICRSTSRRRRRANAAAMPSRSICGSGLRALTLPEGSTLQVVEVPPGPPVLATLLAEIYGPDAATRRAVAEQVKTLFRSVPFIVDVGDSYGHPRPRLRVAIDQDELEYFGVEQSDVYDTVQALFGGIRVGYSHRGEERDPIEIRIGLPKSDLSWSAAPGRHAGAGQYAARQQDRGGTWPGRAGREGTGLAGAVPPRRAFRRHGDGGTRRRVRGADLRHARGAQGDRRSTTGASCRSPRSACAASRPTSRSRRCCGTASGRSPTSRSATWAPRSGWRCWASTSWWSRSSAASSCRW